MRFKKFSAFALALGFAVGIGGTARAEAADNDFVIGYIGGEKYITEYRGSGGDIVIPEGIYGIGEMAFQTNGSVTGITFPASCKRIEQMAFSGATGITSVTFEGDMETVGLMSFLGCTALERVTFMGDVVNGDDGEGGIFPNAFMGCPKLKTVEFAENSHIDAIERAAFMDCASLTEVKFPREVGRICEYAFMNCPQLTRLEIPAMTELEDFAAGYMYDEETAREIRADGITSVRADMDFDLDDPKLSEVVQKPVTLVVAEGSPAEDYAKANGIAYEYKSAESAEKGNPVTGVRSVLPPAFAAAFISAALLLNAKRKNSSV